MRDKLRFLEKTLKQNQSFLDMLFNTIPSPIFYKDINGIYRHCNEAFSMTILGIHKDKIIGKSLYDIPDLIPRKLADIYSKKDQELFDSPGVQNYEAEVKCADGLVHHYKFYKSTFLSETKEVLGIVGVMLDITESKQAMKNLDEKNKILNKISTQDYLTKLLNRRDFEKIFNRKISMLTHHKQPFALILLDIDFFKAYNDTFGHVRGDNALVSIANTLNKIFSREIDFVFRLGGEEFGVIFNFSDIDDAFKIIRKLLKDIENLEIEAGNTIVSNFLTISAGVGFFNTSSKEKISFLDGYEKIDSLLYSAKDKGRNQFLYTEFS